MISASLMHERGWALEGSRERKHHGKELLFLFFLPFLFLVTYI